MRSSIPPQPVKPRSLTITLPSDKQRQQRTYGLKQAITDVVTNRPGYQSEAALAAQRMAICQGCKVDSKPMLVLGICKACGCKMSIKVKLAEARCPKFKW